MSEAMDAKQIEELEAEVARLDNEIKIAAGVTRLIKNEYDRVAEDYKNATRTEEGLVAKRDELKRTYEFTIDEKNYFEEIKQILKEGKVEPEVAEVVLHAVKACYKNLFKPCVRVDKCGVVEVNICRTDKYTMGLYANIYLKDGEVRLSYNERHGNHACHFDGGSGKEAIGNFYDIATQYHSKKRRTV